MNARQRRRDIRRVRRMIGHLMAVDWEVARIWMREDREVRGAIACGSAPSWMVPYSGDRRPFVGPSVRLARVRRDPNVHWIAYGYYSLGSAEAILGIDWPGCRT
jgi:hypothetical protein